MLFHGFFTCFLRAGARLLVFIVFFRKKDIFGKSVKNEEKIEEKNTKNCA